MENKKAGPLKMRVLAMALSSFAVSASAEPFELASGAVTGDFSLLIGTGFGVRVKSIDTSPEFAASGFAVSGDKNYDKNRPFALYVKAVPELSLAMPEHGVSFLARATLQHDFAADRTNTPLPEESRKQLVNNHRLLDFWVSKNFNFNDRTGRVRVGNQVINWGETLYASGGINAINAYDYQKYSIPGTLLKEVLQPAPIISVAGGLADGLRVEAYYQLDWNANIFAPVGGYFSSSDAFGKGSGWNQIKPKDSGQYGISAHYKGVGSGTDLGFYFIQYHDKTPVYEYDNNTGIGSYRYLEDRRLFGVSANSSLGDWAIGWEASYRPKDAIGVGGCFPSRQAQYDFINGPYASPMICPASVDAKKVQTSVSAVLALAPNEYPLLMKSILNAQGAQLSIELVGVQYNVSQGSIRRNVDGVEFYQPVLAGGYYFQDNNGNLVSRADRRSGSISANFNWSYDASLIPGWIVTPDLFYSYQKGDNPSAAAGALDGQQAGTVGVYFTKNASKNVVTAGLSYTGYFGGKNESLVRQYFRDRNFVGGYVNVTF